MLANSTARGLLATHFYFNTRTLAGVSLTFAAFRKPVIIRNNFATAEQASKRRDGCSTRVSCGDFSAEIIDTVDITGRVKFAWTAQFEKGRGEKKGERKERKKEKERNEGPGQTIAKCQGRAGSILRTSLFTIIALSEYTIG
jgi:hypothetical protein